MDSLGGHTAFLSGPLVMPPDVTLLVDPGVTLFFSRNAQDFDLVPGVHTCGTIDGNSANKSCKPPIDIPDTSPNVGIMGFGKLNARGGDPLLNGFATPGFPAPTTFTWWNLAALDKQQVPEAMIQLENGATNITLYKITLQNSSMFHVKSIGSMTNLTAWDIKIETPTFTNNTDGIDPDQAQNVTLRTHGSPMETTTSRSAAAELPEVRTRRRISPLSTTTSLPAMASPSAAIRTRV
jgi:polygalacturonase